MRVKDERKYITETDIFDKETRIDLIIDILDLIQFGYYKPKSAVQNIAILKGIEEELLIKLLPDAIQEQIEKDNIS